MTKLQKTPQPQPPQMTYAQKMARAEVKKQMLLRFLASGEVYTTTQMAARLLCCSTRAASTTLSSLAMARAVKFESHLVGSHKTTLWGITPHGLALTGKIESAIFELGRTNPAYIPHHIQTQAARLAAESAGWTNWVPGKILYNSGLKKVPDALATNPSGEIVAIEIERNAKTLKRYEEVMGQHLQELSNKKWKYVHYVCPAGLASRIENIFSKIESVKVGSSKETIEQKHRDRFKFFDLASWPTS